MILDAQGLSVKCLLMNTVNDGFVKAWDFREQNLPEGNDFQSRPS